MPRFHAFITDKHKITACIVTLCILIACYFAAQVFSRLWVRDTIIPGPGVTKVGWISDYFPRLKGKPGDTPIYFLDSGQPGATFSILGGVHPDETSGVMTAIILIENARATVGKLIVIPQANASGFTHNYAQEAFPQFIHYITKEGSVRRFRSGARQANPIHHWPDPEVFVHYPTGQKLSGEEIRNLNRAFPGRPDGTFTEQVAYAITEMIKKEQVDFNVDLHEAVPEYPFINAMGIHEKAVDVATLAAMELQMQDIDIALEMSPPKFRGLSYREIGDYTPAMSLLSETANPALGRIRGVTDEALILEGKDAFYVQSAKLGRTFTPFTEEGWPLNIRVGRNLAMLNALFTTYGELHTDKPIAISGVPDYSEISQHAVGHYLNSVIE